MSEIRSVLDDVFKVPEEEVRTFSEVMRTPVAAGQAALQKGDFERIKEGTPDKVQVAARLTTQTNNFIVIESGYDSENYVWHIEPHKSRRWQVSLDRAIYAAIKVLNEVIPNTIRVNVFMPFSDWENQVVTFKALDLKSAWNVSEEDLKATTLKLFEVLRALV